MKKYEQTLKLRLSRETLTSLENGKLPHLKGGICQTSGAAHSCPTILSNCCTTTD